MLVFSLTNFGTVRNGFREAKLIRIIVVATASTRDIPVGNLILSGICTTIIQYLGYSGIFYHRLHNVYIL